MIEKESLQARLPEIVYEPSHGWISLRLLELWEYRELLYFLTWRDIKVRYKQAVLGMGWAVLQPVVSMVIFSVIFGNLAKLPSEGVPYALFSFAALLPWLLFSGALQRAGNSLVGNSNLLTKVYFPRLIIPLSAILAGLVDFGISFLVLLAMTLFYGVIPTWHILAVIPLTLLTLMTALAAGLWLSAINVQYRDVQYLIPFLVQALMYLSPVAYSAELVTGGVWKYIYGLNPLAGIIQGFRWALLGTHPPDELLLISTVIVLFLLISGIIYFRHTERTFADVV